MSTASPILCDGCVMHCTLFPLAPAWLPNTEGFKFEALLQDGQAVSGEVVRGPDGMYTTKGVAFKDIVRWRRSGVSATRCPPALDALPDHDFK